MLLKYGADGYALYWLCLELIADRLDKDHADFELKHDAELLGSVLKIDTLRVEEIMKYFLSLKLFESDCSGVVTCYKLASRLDRSTARCPQVLAIMENVDTEKYREVRKSTEKYGQVRKSPARLDKIRLEEEYMSDFETLWKAYPRKVNKKAASHAYHARRKEGVEHALLSNSSARYSEECKRERVADKYIMHLATFLGGRYTEYVGPPVEEIHETPIEPWAEEMARKGRK